jgi:glycine/D-amino acid oxidase-like deaminating enzyme
MLGDPRSRGLWEATAPKRQRPERSIGRFCLADVVVVGGGYTGMSCALHLAEAGRRVVLLESREIGFGGAGRNVGLINAGLWLMPDDLVHTLGPVYGGRLLQRLGDSVVMALIDRHRIECELERTGALHCAVGRACLNEIKERETQWQRRRAPVRALDADETARRLKGERVSSKRKAIKTGRSNETDFDLRLQQSAADRELFSKRRNKLPARILI